MAPASTSASSCCRGPTPWSTAPRRAARPSTAASSSGRARPARSSRSVADRRAAVAPHLAHHQVDGLDAVRALVDRRDAHVAQPLRDAGLLDEARAAVHLHRDRGDPEALVGRPRLRERREEIGARACRPPRWRRAAAASRVSTRGGRGACAARRGAPRSRRRPARVPPRTPTPARWRAARPRDPACPMARRAAFIIVNMIGMPWHSPPMSSPNAPSSSMTHVGLEWMPSLCSRRAQRMPLRVPSGSTFGTANTEMPREPGRRVGRAREHEVEDVVDEVVLAPGDEDLLAVEQPEAVGTGTRRGAQRADVGARGRLGHAHRGAPLAAHQRAQVALLLLRRRPPGEEVDPAVGERRHERQREVRRGEQLLQRRGRHRSESPTADVGGRGGAAPAAVGERAPGALDLGRDRDRAVGCEPRAERVAGPVARRDRVRGERRERARPRRLPRGRTAHRPTRRRGGCRGAAACSRRSRRSGSPRGAGAPPRATGTSPRSTAATSATPSAGVERRARPAARARARARSAPGCAHAGAAGRGAGRWRRGARGDARPRSRCRRCRGLRVATVMTTGGRHDPSVPVTCARSSIVSRSRRAASARGRSALFTTNTSASSSSPALLTWIASPHSGVTTTTVVSASAAISASTCPTPTVSMMTGAKPSASSRRTAGGTAAARPPVWPRLARLRKNVGVAASMRTRSPRMAPPDNGDDGSTASTAPPAARGSATSAATRLDLPTPGCAGEADHLRVGGRAVRELAHARRRRHRRARPGSAAARRPSGRPARRVP